VWEKVNSRDQISKNRVKVSKNHVKVGKNHVEVGVVKEATTEPFEIEYLKK